MQDIGNFMVRQIYKRCLTKSGRIFLSFWRDQGTFSDTGIGLKWVSKFLEVCISHRVTCILSLSQLWILADQSGCSSLHQLSAHKPISRALGTSETGFPWEEPGFSINTSPIAELNYLPDNSIFLWIDSEFLPLSSAIAKGMCWEHCLEAFQVKSSFVDNLF